MLTLKVIVGPLMILSIAIGYALASDEEKREAMLRFIKRVPKAMGCFVDTLVGNALNDPQFNDIIKLQKQYLSWHLFFKIIIQHHCLKNI